MTSKIVSRRTLIARINRQLSAFSVRFRAVREHMWFEDMRHGRRTQVSAALTLEDVARAQGVIK